MKIKLTSVLVNDQDKALKFYTEILGFQLSKNFPMGKFKWLTVTSPEGGKDIELLLEPNENPAAKTFQEALFSQGIPTTAFNVDDIEKEFSRLTDGGVIFKTKPTQMGPALIAVFDDTCGNWIQIYQV